MFPFRFGLDGRKSAVSLDLDLCSCGDPFSVPQEVRRCVF